MIEKYLTILDAVRKGQIPFSNFEYQEEYDSDKHSYDKNHKQRFQLLTALQYNLTANDELLLQQLFEQEIVMHRKAPFQGLYASGRLNAYLLSTFKTPKNVWLFVAFKQANFDTHCGFDYEHLVSGGIEDTYNFVASSENNLKQSFYEYVGDDAASCYITDDALFEWRMFVEQQYSITGKRTIEDDIQLALDLNEQNILSDRITEWINMQKIWDEKTYTILSNYEKMRNNIIGEIAALEKIIDIIQTPWDKAIYTNSLNNLYLATGETLKPWLRLKEVQNYLINIPNWQQIGLGRFLVENAIDITLLIGNAKDAVAIAAYKWGIEQAHKMDGFHLNLLEKLAKAADMMGSYKNSKKYYDKLYLERKKMDELLNKNEADNYNYSPTSKPKLWDKLF